MAESSVAPLNQYRAGPGMRSGLMHLNAPREIVAVAGFCSRQQSLQGASGSMEYQCIMVSLDD